VHQSFSYSCQKPHASAPHFFARTPSPHCCCCSCLAVFHSPPPIVLTHAYLLRTVTVVCIAARTVRDLRRRNGQLRAQAVQAPLPVRGLPQYPIQSGRSRWWSAQVPHVQRRLHGHRKTLHFVDQSSVRGRVSCVRRCVQMTFGSPFHPCSAT
jgi:hypothetical protein